MTPAEIASLILGAMPVDNVEEWFISGEFLATLSGQPPAQPIVFQNVGLLYKIRVAPATGHLWRAGLVCTAQLVADTELFQRQIGHDEEQPRSDPPAHPLPRSNERERMSIRVSSLVLSGP